MQEMCPKLVAMAFHLHIFEEISKAIPNLKDDKVYPSFQFLMLFLSRLMFADDDKVDKSMIYEYYGCDEGSSNELNSNFTSDLQKLSSHSKKDLPGILLEILNSILRLYIGQFNKTISHEGQHHTSFKHTFPASFLCAT